MSVGHARKLALRGPNSTDDCVSSSDRRGKPFEGAGLFGQRCTGRTGLPEHTRSEARFLIKLRAFRADLGAVSACAKDPSSWLMHVAAAGDSWRSLARGPQRRHPFTEARAPSKRASAHRNLSESLCAPSERARDTATANRVVPPSTLPHLSTQVCKSHGPDLLDRL